MKIHKELYRMKKAMFLTVLSIMLSSCFTSRQLSFESHYISMNEKIDDEHVKYSSGSLYIDDEKIDIPEGDRLRISYRELNGTIKYSVRVDGNLVKDVEIAAET